MTRSFDPVTQAVFAHDELAAAALSSAASQRILLLDGAMGTQIQGLGLDETHFRGDRFQCCERHLKGNNDLLTLTQPRAIEEIHFAYAMAGADILETNTFSSTSIAQADYGTEDVVYELNRDGARLARRAAIKAERTDGRRRYVAGALGPTNRTASLSPDVNNPGFRAVTFDELRIAYREQIRGLIDGGVDLLLIETIFDTLNAKAAIFACIEAFAERGVRLPLMISGTITDRSGRTLSGQTPTAFWHSVRHARPFSVGLNCALGASAMREHLAEIAEAADTFICAYPNAGLPNAFGQYDESPETMAAQIAGFAADGLVNIVGGCCGSTPDHIRAIAEAVRTFKPRTVREGRAADAPVRPRAVHAYFGHSLRQHWRANERDRLGQVSKARDRRRLRRRARGRARPGRERRADHRRQHGRGADRFESGDGRVSQPCRLRAGYRARAGDGQFLEILGHRSRTQMRPGQGDRQLDLDEGGRGGIPAPGAARARLWRGGGGDGVR